MSDAVNFCNAPFKITDLKVGSELMYDNESSCVVEFNKGFVVVTRDCGNEVWECYHLAQSRDRDVFIHRFGNLCLSFVGKPASEVYND